MRTRARSRSTCVAAAALLLGGVAALSAQDLERLADGVALPLAGRRLELRVCRDDIVRVLDAPPGAFFARPPFTTVADACQPTRFEVQAGTGAVTLTTARLAARVTLPGGAVTFRDPEGRTLLAEKTGGGRSMTPAQVMGESTFHVQAEFEPQPGEGYYGLGAHQHGWMSFAGRDVDLYQLNTVDIVPFLVSSRGYGLLWENTSHSKFGDTRAPEHVPAANLIDAEGEAGGLTGTYWQGDCGTGRVVGTRKDARIAFGAPEDRPAISEVHNAVQATSQAIHPGFGPGPVCVAWEGAIESGPAGAYDLVTFSNNGVRLSVDGRPVLDTWRQGWLPWWDSFRFDWGARTRHRVRLEWRKEDGDTTLRLKWKPPPRSPYTSLWSEVGDGIDYYFVYGPMLDDVVAGYRELTGRAPLVPRWALGLWQSRERYQTQQESLDTLAEFRRRGIPVDTIVQDWLYWKDDQWGSHAFDETRFPDPAGWIRQIHDRHHARLMISVWPKFYASTENFRVMKSRGFLYPETLKRPTKDWRGHVHTFYDAFHPQARALFWDMINTALFSQGVDAWWMDATEPELVGEGTPGALKAAMHPTAMGSGARMANAYALPSSQAVYEGQRGADPGKRVFNLTRSAFAGTQRYAAATWSGDVSADWDSLARQIPAGLNMSLSGIPWWTTDIGGFAVPQKWSGPSPKPEDVEEWRELVTRWFQFGTFCPLTRVHGQFPNREMWFFGDEGHRAYRTQLAFDQLRYRMLPYNYSLAADVTRHHRTILRPLVMDFPDDPQALDIRDQYLFGPALLVSPVTRPGVARREVYLPRGTGWYDFWTGARLAGGQTIDAPAPLESIPLHVRAGTILAMGPELQYTGEKPADPLTLWVYTGRDAAFELYEDDGVSYAYEQGAFSTIPVRYDEASGALTIGPRAGRYPGMLDSRTIRVVFVSQDHAIGHTATPAGARAVRYDGGEIKVEARPRVEPDSEAGGSPAAGTDRQ
jgi:alpha-D-xyloside xylohydrolase